MKQFARTILFCLMGFAALASSQAQAQEDLNKVPPGPSTIVWSSAFRIALAVKTNNPSFAGSPASFEYNLAKQKTIGDGTCFAFVEYILKIHSCKTTFDYGVFGVDKDFVWGNLVATVKPGTPVSVLDKVRPGDVLQFNKTKTKLGYKVETVHSAIVLQNKGNGNIEVAHQNWNNQKYPDITTYDLGQVQQGTVWAYRPVFKTGK